MKIKKVCQSCKSNYVVPPSREQRSKFCSFLCKQSGCGKLGGKAGKGISRNKGRERPDLAKWNRENPTPRGDRNPNWKGEDICYAAKHAWMTRTYGRPTHCEECSSVKKLQWANISNNHLRERKDWKMLCAPCHRVFDKDIHEKSVRNRSKKFTIEGVEMTIKEIGERFGVKPKLIRERMRKYGYSLDRAIKQKPYAKNYK